jgi:SAM-dependent methyltransferase
MRKLYVQRATGGDTPILWDHAWHGVDLEYELERFRAGRDPVVRALESHVSPGSRVLEAGSGSGRVLEYLLELGCRAVGVDFAWHALREARGRRPHLPAAVADVQRLPFADQAFDRVVSLGLVEHFEEGAVAPLREHRRVLRPGGLLLLTVPRVSPLKRWNDWRSLSARRRTWYRSWRGHVVTRVAAAAAGRPPGADRTELGFYQYEFSASEIERALREAGFTPLLRMPTSVSLGLRELAVVRAVFSRLAPAGERGVRSSPGGARGGSGHPWRAAVRSVVGSERGAGLPSRVAVRLLRSVAGHVHFVVARAT